MKTFAEALNSFRSCFSLKFFFFICSIIASETIFMACLSSFNFTSAWHAAVLDGVFIGVCSSVFCYFLYVHPLDQSVQLNKALRSELELFNSNLQHQVSEQSARLQGKNKSLSRNFKVQLSLNKLLSLALSEASLEHFLKLALKQILGIPWLITKSKGLIFLVNKKRDTLVLRACHGFGADHVEPCQKVSMGKCLCGESAATNKEFFCSSNVSTHKLVCPVPEPHSHWCLPIIDKEETIGVINIYVSDDKEPAKYIRNFLRSAAAIIALALKRRQNEQRIKLMGQAVDQSPIMVSIADATGKIEVANISYLAGFGFALSEVEGQDITFLDSADEQSPNYDKLWETILEGRPWKDNVYECHKNGARFWARTLISPIKDSAGQITNFLVFKEDITKETNALIKQKELEENAHRLQRFQLVGTVASGIAHDFKNILQAVTGFSELALSDTSLEDAQKNVSEIFVATTRGMDLINRFRSIGAPDTECEKRFSLSEQVKEVCSMLNAIIPLGIKLVVNYNAEDDAICALASSIQRVILNMCINSIHSMKGKGGLLAIGLTNICLEAAISDSILQSKPGDFVKLQIKDVGTGIPEDLRAKIFEPYFTTKPPEEGTGLGLSSVLDTMENSGGFMTLSSSVGVGTTFCLYFPAADKLGKQSG